MSAGAARSAGALGALLLALALVAGGVSATARASTEAGARVEVRLWQDVTNPLRLYVSARVLPGRWDALGTVRLLLDDGLSPDRRERFGDVAVEGVEIRVSQDVHDPLRLHVGARARGGDWEALPGVRLVLDDGLSSDGRYRYGDATLAVPPAPERPAVTVAPAGDEVPRLAALTVTFRKPPPARDPATLVSISPPAPGSFAWLDDRTLLFQPDFPGWGRGQRYRVVVDAAAAGLDAPHVHHFTAEGRLEIAYVIPGDGDREVPAEAQVLVQFSRSVAPLTVLEERPAETVLDIDPPLAGRGEWLSTSLYRFVPEGLAPSTEYTVRIAADVSASADGVLASDYSWSFSTIQPAVARIEPADGTIWVEPDARVLVTFNQPMERASVEAGLTLRDAAGEEVPGSISWSEDATEVTLIPGRPLDLGAEYEVVAEAGLRGSERGAMRSGRSARFTTVHPPELVGTTPEEGEGEARCCTLRLHYNNPMDPESFPGRVLIDGEPVAEGRLYVYDDEVVMWGVLEHSRTHTVRIAAGVRDRGGRALPASEFSFTVRPPDPRVYFTGGPFAITPVGAEQVVAYDAAGVEEIRFRLYRISEEQAVTLLRRGFIDGWDSEAGERLEFEPAGDPLREWAEPVDEGTAGRSATSLAAGGALGRGHYFLDATDPLAVHRAKLVVSVVDTAILTKLAHDQLLVWALDHASGEPVAGVEVRVGPAGGTPHADDQSARTDAGGLARFTIPPVRGSYWSPYGDYLAWVGGSRTGVAATWWDRQVSPYDLGVPSSGYHAGLRGHLYTDRPIYRPGESVSYRGVVRWDDDAAYSLPAPDAALTLEVRDPRYDALAVKSVELGGLGSFAAELALPADAPTGTYRLTLTGPDGDYVTAASFRVAEFRVPEVEVEVAADPDHVAGDLIDVDAMARFFFGGPVAGADVTWAAHSSPTYFRAEGYEGYSFSGERRRDAEPLRARGEAQTDARGSARFTVPAAVEEGAGTQLVTLSATVTDLSGQAVAASTTATVHPATWYAGVRTDSYVARAGEAQPVHLVTVDTRGRPAPGRPLTLRILEREWVTTLEQTESGDYRYRSERRDTEIDLLRVTTGADGEATLSFTPPEAGRYVLVAESTDNEGRVARSERSVWASGSAHAPWLVRDDSILDLVADRESYNVGDVARVLVPAPFAGVWGLVTTERGRVLTSEVRPFESNSEVLLVPIEEGHLPNVFVGVVLYRPPTAEDPLPRYRIGYVNLPVSTEEARLHVRIAPDREQATPGERVRYEVEVTDTQGRGVPAELSVAIVDEALLSLAEEAGPDALEAFWSERSLGVRTAWSLAPTARRGPVAAAPAAAVGDDFDARAVPEARAEGEADGARTRSDFRHTALWLGRLATDGRGRASFELTLPDNATTWRALARAVTAETEVGEGESELLVTQPLLVRPALPRFLRAGDEVVLRALVRNGTGETLLAAATIEASGVVLEDEAARSVHVGPGESVLVGWPARAVTEGEATVLIRALAAGGLGDAVALTIPVHAAVTPETVATGGVVEEAPVVEAVYLPEQVPTERGSLEIALQGSLVGALDEELPALAPYRWESTVRLASRIVATVAVRRASPTGLTGAQEAQLLSDIEDLVEARRYGGWAWCRSCSEANPWVTGWALVALGEARAAGYEVPDDAYSRSLETVTRELDRERDVEDPPDPNQHAYLLYALIGAAAEDGEAGPLAREQAERLLALVEERRAELASWGRAYAVLGLLRSGHGAGHPAVRALLNDVAASAISSANGSHWEDERIAGCMHNGGVRATALVLRALTEAAPSHPLIEEAARWLVLARSEQRWTTSVERAEGMAALGAFAELTGEARGVYDYRVLLQGRRVLDGRFDVPAGDRFDGVALPLRDLEPGGVSRVQLEREAGREGRMYYRLHLRYQTPAREVEALSRGFAVSRRYSLLDDPETPITGASVGDVVRVSVTVVAPAERLFARVEDFLPAGLEPVDPQLDIVPPWLREQLREEQAEARRRHAPDYAAPWYGWYYSPWDQTDLRDDRLVLLASRLPAGVHEYVYYARATVPGDFFVAPAHVEETYFPEVFGRSDSGRFLVAE